MMRGILTTIKFCESCGRKVSLNGQLCARCGADLSDRGEEVIGCIDNVGVSTKISLIFTSNRMIAAETQSFAQGLLLDRGLGSVLAAQDRGSKQQKLRSSDPEEIISAHKNNYALPYSEITQLRVKIPKGGGWKGHARWGITVATTQEKKEKEFLLPASQNEELQRTLNTLLQKLKQPDRLGRKLIIEE